MARSYNIQTNLTNCTVVQLETPVTAGGSSTVVLRADIGFEFAEPFTVTYMLDSEGYYGRATFAISDDKTTASAVINDIGSNITIKATATAVQPATDYVITTALTNTTVEAPQGFNAGEAVHIVITANRRFYFGSQTPFVAYTDTEGNEVTRPFEMDGNSRGELTITDADSNIAITAVATSTPDVATLENNLTNADTNLPLYLDFGSTYNVSVTARQGFAFDSDAHIYIGYETSDGYYSQLALLDTDGRTATGTITIPAANKFEDFKLHISGTAQPVTTYGGIYGSINVYKVTNEQLQAFARERYIVRTDPQTGVSDYDDMGQFVVKLHRVYCDIGNTQPTTIKAGRFTTDIEAETPVTDVQRVEFGTVHIPAHNGDITDYQSDIVLFLPFIGNVSLDANTVVDNDISVAYEINIVSGDCAAFVTCNGVTIYNNTCKAVSQLLYRAFDDNFGNLDVNPNAGQGLQPYVVVKWYASKQAKPYSTNQRATIGTFDGYSTFVDVADLNANGMYLNEYNDILQKLQNGVTILPQ